MIKITRIKTYLNQTLWFIAKHSIIFFFLLFFLALLLGGLVFYQYSFLAEKSEPRVTIQLLKFKESLYEEISREWEERQRSLEETEEKIYPYLFRSLPVIENFPPEEHEEVID